MRAPILTTKRARSLRRKLTLPEIILWQKLRSRRFGKLRFRRQHPIGPYILDFYCPAHRLAVEIDSSAHDSQPRQGNDKRRDHWLTKKGIKVVRFAAADILNDERLGFVLGAIASIYIQRADNTHT